MRVNTGRGEEAKPEMLKLSWVIQVWRVPPATYWTCLFLYSPLSIYLFLSFPLPLSLPKRTTHRSFPKFHSPIFPFTFFTLTTSPIYVPRRLHSVPIRFNIPSPHRRAWRRMSVSTAHFLTTGPTPRRPAPALCYALMRDHFVDVRFFPSFSYSHFSYFSS